LDATKAVLLGANTRWLGFLNQIHDQDQVVRLGENEALVTIAEGSQLRDWHAVLAPE